jgi:hypothetical protein
MFRVRVGLASAGGVSGLSGLLVRETLRLSACLRGPCAAADGGEAAPQVKATLAVHGNPSAPSVTTSSRPFGPVRARVHWAEAARTRMLSRLYQRCRPGTSATLNQLLDRYRETPEVGRTTRRTYTRCLDEHVGPVRDAVDPDVPGECWWLRSGWLPGPVRPMPATRAGHRSGSGCIGGGRPRRPAVPQCPPSHRAEHRAGRV